jgi:hypothetical protein
MMTYPTPQELQAQLDKLALQLSHMRWRDLRNRFESMAYRQHPELIKAIDRVALNICSPGRCQHAIDAALEDAEALCDRYQWGTA